MEFKSMIKAHDLNPCQFIYPKPNFSLATSRPNFHWQHQSPILIGKIKTHRIFIGTICQKRVQDYQYLAKKKYHGKILPWQKPWQSSYKKKKKKLIGSYLENHVLIKYLDIICIATSIIYAFDTHGKHSNPQDHHLSYDAIIRNHEHYCNMEFIKVNIIYKSILKLDLLFQTLQLIGQRPIASIYEKPKNIY